MESINSFVVYVRVSVYALQWIFDVWLASFHSLRLSSSPTFLFPPIFHSISLRIDIDASYSFMIFLLCVSSSLNCFGSKIENNMELISRFVFNWRRLISNGMNAATNEGIEDCVYKQFLIKQMRPTLRRRQQFRSKCNIVAHCSHVNERQPAMAMALCSRRWQTPRNGQSNYRKKEQMNRHLLHG